VSAAGGQTGREIDGPTALLLAEHNHAVVVCNHLDNLRNVLTSFFLTLNGGVLIAASLVVKGEVASRALGSPEAFLATLALAVAALGTLFVATIARMRRVQIERYRIANAVLDTLLDPPLRDVVPYSNNRLSRDAGGSGLLRRLTGSYLWTLALVLPTAVLAGYAAGLLAGPVHDVVGRPWSAVLGVLVAAVVAVANDVMYFQLSAPPPEGAR
jgi:hypothetical protein